ncbi:MAG TPA: TetR/AcrR family transcriptional regulator [Acidimicrobiia bacterium]|nr:TetR/AcrR family transcriptional regulator [Acidimicrobiia bacterium]
MQPATDGRVQRGERNRAAIVDALLALLEDGVRRPSARQIAERAEVSLRSVFQHFDDMESLYAECVRRQHERVTPLLTPIDVDAPLEERIEAVVVQRSRVFERIAPIRRAAVQAAAESPVLRNGLAATAKRFREQTAAVFAAEVDDELLSVVDLVTSFDAWEQLRTTQKLSVTNARRVMVRALKELMR